MLRLNSGNFRILNPVNETFNLKSSDCSVSKIIYNDAESMMISNSGIQAMNVGYRTGQNCHQHDDGNISNILSPTFIIDINRFELLPIF